MQRLCPADPIPDASAAERRLCSEDFAEATLGEEGTFFEACVKAAANTECKDTVLAVDGGSRTVPDWCIDYSSNRTVATFSCPGQVDAAPKYVYCAESIRTAKCGNEFCQGGPTVRLGVQACLQLSCDDNDCSVAVFRSCHSRASSVPEAVDRYGPGLWQV